MPTTPGIFLRRAAAAVIAAAVVAGGVWYYHHASSTILWTMVDVAGNRHTGDAHLLELPGDHVILIDTGMDRYTRHDLIPYMERRGIDHINQLIITHAHSNHYGGVESLLKYIGRVEHVYFNLPPESRCSAEDWPTGCDYEMVRHTREMIEKSPASLTDLETGEQIYRNEKQNIVLEVVYVHDGISEPIGPTDINDTSAVLRLTYGDTTVLFTGDLNKIVARHLVEEGYALESRIMTAPHHGVESAAGNEFLEKVDPEVMLVTNNTGSWLSPRGERMRQFVADTDLETYVSGLHGNVVIRITPSGYAVSPERRPRSSAAGPGAHQSEDRASTQ